MNDKKPTVTGRYAHTMPRAMDFANRKGETLHVELPDDDKSLVEADYSEIEKRVMAHYAVELDKDMPRKIGKHPALAMPYGTEAKPEPTYERFLCLNGDMEGRGLIVPMPADHVAGYDLMTLRDGTRVAIQKERETCSALSTE